MKNILEYLEKSSLVNINKIAIIEENKMCSYIELIENSKKCGTAISESIKPRNPVPILMEKGINAIYTFFGAIYAGCFYVLLNPELPISRLKKILEILQSSILITDEKNFELAEMIKSKENIMKIEDIKGKNVNEEVLMEIRKQSLDVDPLYANFTSGSTGVPKGVLISHKSTIDFIDIFTEKFNITSDDVIGNQAPFDFDVSVKDIYSTIKTGATLVIIPKKLFRMPAKLLDYICEQKVTTLIWAVSALCLITTFHGLEYRVPKTVNKIMFSGEVMPIKHLKQWIEYLRDATYVNLYGPTEITCNCAYHIIDKNLPYDKQIPIGKNFENEQVFLIDENNESISKKDVIGEICVKGTALALGYYNNLKQTNESFIQNPLNDKYMDLIYKTGDLGYYDENKILYFFGRKDFQIKHMGHRIELEEIEYTIGQVDGIERVCCIYDENKSKLYAFYIGSITKIELRKKLKDILPVFMIPNSLMQLDNLPITKNGKIDRKKLKFIAKEGCVKNE